MLQMSALMMMMKPGQGSKYHEPIMSKEKAFAEYVAKRSI